MEPSAVPVADDSYSSSRLSDVVIDEAVGVEPREEKYDGHGNLITSSILEPSMGVFSGTAMIVGLMIGSGIFSTPGAVWELVGSAGAALLLWIFGGVITFFGTFAYIELGTMLPRSGGEQAYLAYAFRRPRELLAFMFCLVMIICIRPGSAAADSTIFGKYILYAVVGPKEGLAEGDPMKGQYDWVMRGIGLGCVLSITVLNAVSVRWAIRVHDLLTTVKVLVLLVIAIAGIVVLAGGAKGVENPGNWREPFAGTSGDGHAYATALFKIFWAYDGWNNLNYSIGELRNPERNLPIAAGVGVSLVTLLYVMANVAYLSAVPMGVAFASNEVLAGNFGTIVFGETVGQRVLPVFIALSTYGSVCAMVFSASRVMFVAGQEGYLPYSKMFGTLHPRYRTPMAALVFNFCCVVVLMLAPPPGESFEFLVEMVGYPTWVFYGVSVVGLLLLRRREPELHRPFRVWWPLAVVFILVSIFLSIFPFIPATRTVHEGSIPYFLSPLLGLIVIFLPVPLYYVMITHGGDWRAVFGCGGRRRRGDRHGPVEETVVEAGTAMKRGPSMRSTTGSEYARRTQVDSRDARDLVVLP